MPSLSMDEIIANLEGYGEQAARLAGSDRLYYSLQLQHTLQQETAHLAPLEKSLVIKAAVQVLGLAADIGDGTHAAGATDSTDSAGLLGSEQALIPFNLP